MYENPTPKQSQSVLEVSHTATDESGWLNVHYMAQLSLTVVEVTSSVCIAAQSFGCVWPWDYSALTTSAHFCCHIIIKSLNSIHVCSSFMLFASSVIQETCFCLLFTVYKRTYLSKTEAKSASTVTILKGFWIAFPVCTTIYHPGIYYASVPLAPFWLHRWTGDYKSAILIFDLWVSARLVGNKEIK